MSSLATHQAAERRRMNFLSGVRGVPSEHNGSYQQLRAELGEDNTNRLITNIGTLAISSGIQTIGVSLSDAVQRIIGSLTPAERAAMASGGVAPPRVQALIESELKQAQQQRQAQIAAATNTNADGSPVSKSGLPAAAFASMDRELRGRTSRSSEYADLRTDSISSANYASSQFARTGLNYAAFSEMRNQGFNAPQIMAAVKETKSLGIDTNRNAAPMARLQRDMPSAVPGLHETGKNWSEVKDLEEQLRKAREAGNAGSTEELTRRIEAARKAAEEYDQRERERVQRERPDRAQDHQKLQDEVRRAALGKEAALRNDSRLTDPSAALTPSQDHRVDEAVRSAEVAAATNTEIERTKANLAARFASAPEPQPQQRAAAETPPTTPVKTADATPPSGSKATPPRIASPTVRA